jgi:hypothetical protein
MQYRVNDTVISYESEGSRSWGEPIVLLNRDADLTAGMEWHRQGFTVTDFLDVGRNQAFNLQANALLRECWREAGLSVPDQAPPDQYHTFATDWATHLKALDQTKLLPVSKFPLPIEEIEQRVSAVCQTPVMARNPYDGLSVFHFRVIRPQKEDNNPLHRDVWLEDYKACINLYIPVSGSDERSSLILVPGSHLWPESRIERADSGALINSVQFNVPAVTGIEGEFEAVRPNPGPGQMLVFSPYLIHGGAVNLNPSTTRVSIELRLWKK